jgi:hypothetical protein
VRLVGSQLLEQPGEWQLEVRRFFPEATMAKIPQPEEQLELTDGDAAVAASAGDSYAATSTSTDRHESH